MSHGEGVGSGVDRREMMRWFAALSAALAGGGVLGRAHAFVGAGAAGAGYGRDPDLLQGKATWRRLMTTEQLAVTRLLADHILPAEGDLPSASGVGVHELIDEWISAPYPTQVEDRSLILAGLDWLQSRAADAGSSSFAELPAPARTAILRACSVEGAAQHRFFRRVRHLVIGGYYTTEIGMKDLGYVGNVALTEYPAPSEQVMAVLDRFSSRLGLSTKDEFSA